jgi:hypothetical protein
MLLKTTYNIFNEVYNDELQNTKFQNAGGLGSNIIPPEWDYSREMKIEDVDLWEVLAYEGGGAGVFASFWPFAEFYMITLGHRHDGHLFAKDKKFELFYGPNASKRVYKRARQLGILMWVKKTWVDDDEMWLYTDPHPETSKKIILA